MTFDSQRVIFATPKWRGSAPFFQMGGSLTLRRVVVLGQISRTMQVLKKLVSHMTENTVL